jgi:hypothetical protein
MRIAHCPGEFVVALTQAEASLLVDACALLVLASRPSAQAALPEEMAVLLGALFDGLRPEARVPAQEEGQG